MSESPAPQYRAYGRPSGSRWDPVHTHGEPDGATNGHANGHASRDARAPVHSPESTAAPFATVPPAILPDGRQSLAGISIRAHLLGVALGVCASAGAALTASSSELWRVPFFFGILALFHFLEFYTTAAHNTPAAGVSAFLLTSNGSAYNIAHSLAALETLLSHSVLRYPGVLPAPVQTSKLAIGVGLVVVGQVARSVAMAQAGTNFNHTVQSHRKQGHELVTRGIYAWLRHPSYFGFFWWGIGSQLVLGNVVCLIGYALVLWRFFSARIASTSCARSGLGAVLTTRRGRTAAGRFLW